MPGHCSHNSKLGNSVFVKYKNNFQMPISKFPRDPRRCVDVKYCGVLRVYFLSQLRAVAIATQSEEERSKRRRTGFERCRLFFMGG
uniref:Uncharacterized protein n=1 Tax=Ixodes ricinus TaxID=34613 RepID=A0A6B0U9Q9_IXORI